MEQQAVMSGPTITRGGTSTATVVAGAGTPGVAINGGSDLGSFLIASYGPDTGSSATTVEVTVTPAPGAAFVYYVQGTRGHYSGGEVRLQRAPGTSALQATSSSGNVTCGTLASGRSTGLTIAFDGPSQTFDVLINGAASSCTNLPTNVQLPLVSYGMMDASNQGWGGRVEFTAPMMY
jgi:hypothetical protein